MRSIFRWHLSITAFLSGMLSVLMVVWLLGTTSHDESMLVIMALLVAAVFAMRFFSNDSGLTFFLLPWVIGSLIGMAVFGYCWAFFAIGISVAGIVAACLLFITRSSSAVRTAFFSTIIVALAHWIVLGFDHLAFSGNIAAFKWARIEHPFWRPFEIREPERHGRKVIRVFDMNGADPSAVAFIWGWSLFPKFAWLEEARPEGSMVAYSSVSMLIN